MTDEDLARRLDAIENRLVRLAGPREVGDNVVYVVGWVCGSLAVAAVALAIAWYQTEAVRVSPPANPSVELMLGGKVVYTHNAPHPPK